MADDVRLHGHLGERPGSWHSGGVEDCARCDTARPDTLPVTVRLRGSMAIDTTASRRRPDREGVAEYVAQIDRQDIPEIIGVRLSWLPERSVLTVEGRRT